MVIDSPPDQWMSFEDLNCATYIRQRPCGNSDGAFQQALMMRSKSSHHYSHRLFKRMELIAISHTGSGILPENMKPHL